MAPMPSNQLKHTLIHLSVKMPTFKTTAIKTAFLASVVCLMAVSCRPDKSVVTSANVHHVVGNELLSMDSVRYSNAAGNALSVTRLEYYLSGFELTDTEGKVTALDGVFYVNAEDATTHDLTLGKLNPGSYNQLRFYVGIVPERNDLSKLPNTLENTGMQWPEMMGGGLHFMKMEGHFMDSSGAISGYAVHLGTDIALTSVTINQSFVVSESDPKIDLTMDLLAWYENPVDYDLNGANVTMGDTVLMQLIRDNGGDVFTLQ